MAEKRGTEQRAEQTQGQRGLQRSSEQNRGLAGRQEFLDPFRHGPFTMLRRMQEDMDRLFGSFGFGRNWPMGFTEEQSDWAPAIDAFQRGNEFIIRADVPGLSRDDLSVEISEDTLTIQGERKYDHEEEREGVFHRERSYGSFRRVIPLPEGAIADSAKANFHDGVLEVVVHAPSQEVRRGRRIEIGQERTQKSEQQK
jgi:HSP20 family protein